jgi:hypothetical protein
VACGSDKAAVEPDIVQLQGPILHRVFNGTITIFLQFPLTPDLPVGPLQPGEG